MSGVAEVWLVVGLVSTAAVLAVMIGLVRHVLVLVRSLARFQREITPIAEEIGAQGERAASRARRAGAERSFGQARGRTVR